MVSDPCRRDQQLDSVAHWRLTARTRTRVLWGVFIYPQAGFDPDRLPGKHLGEP